MKCTAAALILAVAAVLLVQPSKASLRSRVKRQPIFEGKVESDDKFGHSADATVPARPPGYRSAWDDCGGIGASATERMRTIAAKIKGWAKPLPFVRHAAQDCGIDKSGTVPGPVDRIIYPGPETLAAGREGRKVAADTLEKYPAAPDM
mmetsp:Transcript_35964/g.75492  ORF Transcript_35964/g.75492 Transcript_35964/m.75492 type:complete len:149 (-) Transcript_35964:182-628(-)